ncbi:hypothetical protein GGU11DRAFT_543326 [Lentinula aff. detonsa]|nr:hypothetical protein GGU11DRAFT_543326 [Lentinula aff. detonsa]
MSGPTRNNSRSANRLADSSPYTRSAPKKSSTSWSISNFLTYLNPLGLTYRYRVSNSADERDRAAREAAESLSSRGHQISESKEKQSPAPLECAQPPPASADTSISPTNATFGHDISPESPQKGLDYLSKYLGDRPKDEPLSSTEAEELISLIKKSTPVEEHETFRFSSSNPSTPLRGNSPLFPSISTNSVPFSFSPSYVNAPSTPSPSKPLLKQNPNGSYRWDGGGSAKQKNGRSRNRYHSPAFGPSPRSSSRLILRESPEKATEPIKTDTKRRRVGEDALMSSSSPSGNSPPIRSPAPAPSPTRAAEALRIPIAPTPSRMSSSHSAPLASNGNGLKAPSTASVNGLRSSASTSRLRVPPKPTTPVVPSPLRQAWGQPSSPTPSSKSSDSTTTSQRATKAANYMNELIKEVTPVKNLDVSNPYQAASPVKIVGNAKAKPRPTKRARASGRPSAPPEGLTINGKADDGKEKEKEKGKNLKGKEMDKEKYSAQDIIQATLPKGSKRSRAPANIGKGLPNGLSAARSPSPPKPKSPFSSVPQIEEVDDEDEEEKSRFNKKSKGSDSESKFTLSPAPSALNGNALNGNALNGNKNRKTVSPIPAAPAIEEVDDDMDGSRHASIMPSEVIEVGNGVSGSEGKSKAPDTGTISSSFPTSTSNRSSVSGASGSSQKISAIPREPSKLRFSYMPESAAPSEPFSINTDEPKKAVPQLNAPFGVDNSKNTKTTTTASVFSGFAVTASSASVVASSNAPASALSAAKPKAIANPKEHVQSLPVTSLPVFSFEHKQPIASGSGLSSGSGSSNTSKAMAAATEFPQSKLPQFDFDSAPPPLASTSKAASRPPKAFDWTAAGVKAPDNTSDWTCSVCMLSNKDSAKKCAICEADRPGEISKAVPPTFDWSAAGMKKPGGTDGGSDIGGDAEWKCSTCMLNNPASALTKCNICDTPRPSSSDSTSKPASATAPVGASFMAPIQSFNWGAAGLKPPEPKPGVWLCDACGLTNPEKAAKCEVCDAPK